MDVADQRSLRKWGIINNNEKWLEAILDADGKVKVKLAGFGMEAGTFAEVIFDRKNWFEYISIMHLCVDQEDYMFGIIELEGGILIESYYKEELEGHTILISNDGRPGERNYRNGVFLKTRTIQRMLTHESEISECFERYDKSSKKQ